MCLPVLLVAEENPSYSYLASDIFWRDQNYRKRIENRIQGHLSLILLRKCNFAEFQGWKMIKNRSGPIKIAMARLTKTVRVLHQRRTRKKVR